jgi:PAS domain S-box-containing protein
LCIRLLYNDYMISPQKILLVEDNDLHLEMFQDSMKHAFADCQIIVMKSIAQTREYLSGGSVDVIITNCTLTDGNASELLDLRNVKDKIPVIYLSCQVDEKLAVSLIKKGAHDYFVKEPLFFKDFPNIISRTLREWKNILARKEAEERLVSAESKYKMVTNNINDVIWELSIDFKRYLFASPSVNDFLGFSYQEFIGIPFENTIHPDSLIKIQDARQAYMSHLRMGMPSRSFSLHLELEFLHKDGSTRWGEVRGFLVTNKKNQVISISGVTRNITQQKATEKRLKIQEAYFETLIQEAPLAIVILDQNDIIRQVNKQFAVLFGYTEAECIGQYINDLIVPDDLRDQGMELTNEVSQGKYINIETIRKTRDGKLLNVSIHGKPVMFDKALLAVFGIYQDITNQKVTEERLQKISERHILATRAASIGIWDYDTKSQEIVWDQEMYRLHGITSDHKDDLMILWEGVVADDDKALLDFIFNQKEYYRKSFENVYRLKTHDGNTKYIRLFAQIHDEEKSGSTRIVGCCLDVTSQIENTELSKQVEISAKVASIKQLLMKSELQPRQKLFAETIKTSSDSLLQIVNDILDLSKIEAGKMVIKPDWFNLKDCGQKVFNLFYALSEQKNIKFTYVFDSSLPLYVYGDEHRISQIITNLISNAIKFTEKGWVKLAIECLEQNNETVRMRFRIQDSGIGIGANDMSKLFNLFSQVDNSDTRNYDGTGLGLAISERLAELMQARILVYSTPGEGSTFDFVFESPKSTNVIVENDLPVLNSNGHRNDIFNILLVEDKKANQMVVSLMLEEYGHKVDIASNGQIALDMFEPGKYDFIFMDVQMPVMDGLTAVRKLRTRYKENELPVIIGLSAKAMEGDPEYYITRGMNDYLTKPVSSETLINCIHKYSRKLLGQDPITTI